MKAAKVASAKLEAVVEGMMELEMVVVAKRGWEESKVAAKLEALVEGMMETAMMVAKRELEVTEVWAG